VNLYPLWAYLVAFWSTVVVNCAQPVNWKNCFPVQDWLVPAVHDYMRARRPYSEERKILDSMEESHGLGRLDERQADVE